jgi:Fe-S-cluster-containing hydrogenase component 2
VANFLVEQGLGEATDVLLIDEKLCVGCDNCEKACADTHDGLSRLDREAGRTYAHLHVPTSCRHCEHPHCMADCPPNAIHRGPTGEVYIDETCIGCGNCQRNCPYGVIRLDKTPPKKPWLLSWFMFGSGPGPGEASHKWAKKHDPAYAEKAKIASRNVRRDGMEALKAAEKKGKISQDEQKRLEADVQKITDKAMTDIDTTVAAKEKEILGK